MHSTLPGLTLNNMEVKSFAQTTWCFCPPLSRGCSSTWSNSVNLSSIVKTVIFQRGFGKQTFYCSETYSPSALLYSDLGLKISVSENVNHGEIKHTKSFLCNQGKKNRKKEDIPIKMRLKYKVCGLTQDPRPQLVLY